MKEGLYRVTFKVGTSRRAGVVRGAGRPAMSKLSGASYDAENSVGMGVVVLRGGVFEGGDTVMAYKGHYEINANSFKANVQVTRHTDNPNIPSVFGVDDFLLDINGDSISDVLHVGEASSVQIPGVTGHIRLDYIEFP